MKIMINAKIKFNIKAVINMMLIIKEECEKDKCEKDKCEKDNCTISTIFIN
ncbi:hypothetical protein HMPREF0789_1715 [Staphylococcus epidermidis BCM-HMP0060]|nr:hypothetical protein HMPREF0789_1715 [Staphylococcus epidermidis BCM-HMP0060]